MTIEKNNLAEQLTRDELSLTNSNPMTNGNLKPENQLLRRQKRRFNPMVYVYLILGLSAIFLSLPFYYMVITSFKSGQELAKIDFLFWIQNPTLEPIRSLLEGTNYLKAAWNSFVVAFFSTGANMLLCPMAGYAFAKHRFPGRDTLFLILLSTMMIPGAVLLVPSFLLLRDFGWINSYLPLIVPTMASVFFIFLSRQFISKIPDALIKAARVDGCSEFRIFFQIVFPLCKPLIASIGILSFLGSWNSFIGPMVYLLDEETYTLPLVISLLQGRFKGLENVQMAGSLLSIIPALILFFVFQKHIVNSFASSGLKE